MPWYNLVTRRPRILNYVLSINPSPLMPPLQYCALDQSRREIRVLRPVQQPQPLQQEKTITGALPGRVTPDLSLEFELQVTSLDNAPSYTALSYVWGDANDVMPITVDGCSFLVTRNLNVAL